jgi:hypothetical protein
MNNFDKMWRLLSIMMLFTCCIQIIQAKSCYHTVNEGPVTGGRPFNKLNDWLSSNDVDVISFQVVKYRHDESIFNRHSYQTHIIYRC